MSRGIRWWTCVSVTGSALAIAVLASCGFTALPSTGFYFCEGFDKIGLSEVVGAPPVTVFEDPGTIKVMHGSGRASYHKGTLVKIEQSAELPPYANQATVFLNGWKLSYNGSDQHLYGVGTNLLRIRVQPGKITWQAAGILCDDGTEEAFTWEYRYTIIAWNDANLRAMVDHNDWEYYCKAKESDGSDNFFGATNRNITTTALSSFPSFLQNPGFASGRTVAVLPRGFGFRWMGGDHHLLQLAYNLESVAPFVRHQPYYKAFKTLNPLANTSAAQVGGEFVSWKTSVIMKDDARRRDYEIGEMVSAMGGPDVEVIQPEFTILPFEDADGGLGGAGLKSAEVVINNLPYACAVPMLTGWDIGYTVSDEHVKELGIWIDDLRYERPPGAVTGTLRYKVYSIVKDDDTFPDNYFRHKVTVLGLGSLVGAPRPLK